MCVYHHITNTSQLHTLIPRAGPIDGLKHTHTHVTGLNGVLSGAVPCEVGPAIVVKVVVVVVA